MAIGRYGENVMGDFAIADRLPPLSAQVRHECIIGEDCLMCLEEVARLLGVEADEEAFAGLALSRHASPACACVVRPAFRSSELWGAALTLATWGTSVWKCDGW